MRLYLLAALLCAAVGASAAFSEGRFWIRTEGETPAETLRLSAHGDNLSIWTARNLTQLTRDEAASLGRALLEAAGEPEKVCPASIFLGPQSGTFQLDQYSGGCACGGVSNAVPGAAVHCLPCNQIPLSENVK